MCLFRYDCMRSMITIVLSVLVTSCATWVKPGASSSDFAADRSTCQAESYQRFPVRMPASDTTDTKCTYNGYTANCRSEAAPTSGIDQNLYPRIEAHKSCMYRHGWRLE